MQHKKLLILALVFALIIAACAPAATPTPTQRPTEAATSTPEEVATEEATEVAAEPTEEATEPAAETEEATEVAAEPTEEETEVAAEETGVAVAMATEEATEPAAETEEPTEIAAEPTVEETEAAEEPTEVATEEPTEEAETPEPTLEETEAAAEPTEEATEVAEVTAPASEEIVFGLVLVGPQNDHGWSQAHYEGGQYVEENLPGARMLVFESLNPASAPETTLRDVVTEMVDNGATLIFTTSDEFEEDTTAVAQEFPDVTFINVSGDDVYTGEAPDNLGNLMGTMEWGKLIAGCAAGLTTQTGQISYLGPLINFETRRLAASAYLGARHCYEVAGGDPEELEFTVTWIGFWFNIPGTTLDPTEVVNNFFDSGADVVISGIDTTEAIVVAGQRAQQGEDVWAVPYDFVGACDAAPDVCLGTPYFHWGPAYLDIVSAVQAGTYEPEFKLVDPDWEDINNEETSAVGFVTGPGLSEENQENLDTFIQEMADFATDSANEGNVYLWVGPLAYQDGTVIAEEGEYVPYIAPLTEEAEAEAPAAEATADATDEADAAVEGASIWYLQQLLEGMTGASR